MGTKDPRIDAYVAKSAAFAKPILTHIRELIHENCPSVEETMKWSFPHFMYTSKADRKSRVLCSMASFKQHCALGFWYSGGWVMSDESRPSSEGMGQNGKITGLSDLPKDRQLVKQIKGGIPPAPGDETDICVASENRRLDACNCSDGDVEDHAKSGA